MIILLSLQQNTKKYRNIFKHETNFLLNVILYLHCLHSFEKYSPTNTIITRFHYFHSLQRIYSFIYCFGQALLRFSIEVSFSCPLYAVLSEGYTKLLYVHFLLLTVY